MIKFSKVIAIALAATMVFGSSLTAFATEPVTTGDSTGVGKSEGHVEKKATNVVLPTITEGTTPFAYTMDPERLISETTHGKYGDTVEFPASNDTGVYFNNGKKGGDGDDKDNIVYANSSSALSVINKSSHNIALTVKAEATAGAKDIPLVAQSAIATATDASLYLGLKVGSEAATAIASDAAATKTVTVNGTPGNFKVAVKSDKSGYEYRALTLDEWKAAAEANADGDQDAYDATWANTSFQLEGEVTDKFAITSDTTAPSIKVTWSWTDPTSNAAPSIATTSYTVDGTADQAIAIDLGLGDDAATGIASITFLSTSGATKTLAADMYALSGTTLTIKKEQIAAWIDAGIESRAYKITFNDTASTEVEVTFTKE